MFERFTDRARRVVVLAQDETRVLNHNYVGTEHILLGLIREDEGVAAQAFKQLGVNLDETRTRIEEIIGRGQQAPHGHIPFTPRAKKVMELSLREALQLGHNYIGTEHLLLALIREGEGVAAEVLGGQGLELNRVRRQVLRLLSEDQGKTAQTLTVEEIFPPFSSDDCPKCLSSDVTASYVEPRVKYSKALGQAVALGEHLRRACTGCDYSWAEACRTPLMAPNSPVTADEDLKCRIQAVEAEHREDGGMASAS